MASKLFNLPASLPELLDPARAQEIKRAQNLLNAIQQLKLQITSTSTGKVTTAVIQISGENAVLQITIP